MAPGPKFADTHDAADMRAGFATGHGQSKIKQSLSETMGEARDVDKAQRRMAAFRETVPTPPYPSTHNLGTNRMSAKASDGVVNKWGQTHDIKNLFVSDGSQFTTGAAENPTLTIVALAMRQADHIARETKKGHI